MFVFQLTAEYKSQRHLADRLNTDLKQKIEDYTQLIKSGMINFVTDG